MGSLSRILAVSLAFVAAGPVMTAVAEPRKGAAEPALEVIAALDRHDQAALDRVSHVRNQAEQGNVESQHELAALLAVGKGTGKDYVEAAKWLERAAEQGHGQSQFWLGNLYMRGVGVPQDYDRMMELWRQAAIQGNVDAQYALGAAYRDGRMVPQDLVRSHSWFFMASNKTGNAFVRENRDAVAKRIRVSKATKAAQEQARRRSDRFLEGPQGGR